MLGPFLRNPFWRLKRFQAHFTTAFRSAGEQWRLDAERYRQCSAREAVIKAYLAENSPRRLQIGSGNIVVEGWLCSDLTPVDKRVIFLDALCPFPFEDEMFDYIHSEHLIEHLPYDGGLFMLRESFRVLREGGRIRIATPDLAVFAHLCVSPLSAEQRAYLDWSINAFLPGRKVARPSFVVNNMFRDWGHQFLYDEETLCATLSDAGFGSIERCNVGESSDLQLSGIERHGSLIGEKNNLFETMVFEGRRPVE